LLVLASRLADTVAVGAVVQQGENAVEVLLGTTVTLQVHLMSIPGRDCISVPIGGVGWMQPVS
jgi:hypothetical protein